MQSQDQIKETGKVGLSYLIIEGAQSTGKTTLIKYLKEVYPGMQVITQVARSVIKQLNITNEDLQSNKDNCFQELQHHIFLAQSKRQQQFKYQKNQQSQLNQQHQNICLLDRCVISPVVYSMHYFKGNQELIEKIQKSDKFRQSIRKYREQGVIILLYPEESILKDDGVRKKATFEQLYKITKIYKEVLNKYQLNYHQIKTLENRVESVKGMLSTYHVN